MSTIASLISLIDPSGIKPWYEGQQGVNREQIGRQQAQTGLIELQRLKQSQASEEEVMDFYRQHPELLVGGGPILGSLQTAPAAPGAAPMTQQTMMPGQPPQAPQMVPGGQDLSQFATQGATGQNPRGFAPEGAQTQQSIIAGLSGQPQGQMQATQNPLMEMGRRDPRALMMLQDQQIKAFTTQLTIREKTAEAFASRLQGVNSQESYDLARQDLMQFAPQQAARLPTVWSKEAVQPFIDSALGAKDKASLDIASLKEQTDLRKQRFAEQQEAAGVPKYTEDSTLNVAIDRRMQQAGIPRGTPPPEAILTQAQEDVETGKVRVSASQGTGQVFDTPEGKMRLRPGTNTVEPLYTPGGQQLQPKPTQAEQETATFGNLAQRGHAGAVELEMKGFKPGILDKAADKLPFGMGNYLTSDDHQKYKDYVLDFAQAWLRKTSKGAITEDEWKLVDQRYFPQPGNSKAQIEQKRAAREAVIKEIEAEAKPTGRTGTPAPPTSQGSTGSSKPVAQMNAEETRAEIAAIKARGGK